MQAFTNTFIPFCGLEHGVANDHMCNTTDNKTSIVDKMEIIQPTSLCGHGVHRNNILLIWSINRNSCYFTSFFSHYWHLRPSQVFQLSSFWLLFLTEETLYIIERGWTMANYFTHLCRQRTISVSRRTPDKEVWPSSFLYFGPIKILILAVLHFDWSKLEKSWRFGELENLRWPQLYARNGNTLVWDD